MYNMMIGFLLLLSFQLSVLQKSMIEARQDSCYSDVAKFGPRLGDNGLQKEEVVRVNQADGQVVFIRKNHVDCGASND